MSLYLHTEKSGNQVQLRKLEMMKVKKNQEIKKLGIQLIILYIIATGMKFFKIKDIEFWSVDNLFETLSRVL